MQQVPWIEMLVWPFTYALGMGLWEDVRIAPGPCLLGRVWRGHVRTFPVQAWVLHNVHSH